MPNTPIVTPQKLDFDFDAADLTRQFQTVAALGAAMGQTLSAALDGVAIKGKSLSDVFNSLALSLSKMALTAAFKPLDGAVSSLFSGLFGGALPAASGLTVPSGTPIPFAHGGIIAAPTGFPLAGNRSGIAGEAGSEAIMPLARGPDGRLGVAASGTGQAMHITFNVTTPDADSFRRSETQMAALLARAVGQGQRNL